MKTHLNRRDFLKLTALLSLGYAVPKRMVSPDADMDSAAGENVLIVVFDAWSASNMSLYGYERQTMPNLEKLADKAIVYHNHYAGGHFTTPGTVSLLTGTTPWIHRAFDFYPALDEAFLQQSIFHAFDRYHRFAYSHNPLTDKLLRQWIAAIDELTLRQSLYLESNFVINSLFTGDFDTASVSWNRTFRRGDDGNSYSLYLAQLYENYKRKRTADILAGFPRGVPNHDGLSFFTLEQGIDWLTNIVNTSSQPFLGYYHFLPPHNPYYTRGDFYNQFAGDKNHQIDKPQNMFTEHTPEELLTYRLWYDEFLLYVDAEFARLYDSLQNSGMLENTWLILTTDHGEMFERGIRGHSAPIFYQPVMNIPLLIFPPGGINRVDINQTTSAIDLLPTLLHVTGQDIPDWIEGQVLEPFSNIPSGSERDITSVQLEKVENGAINAGSAMIVRERYKLTWYFGYDEIKPGDERIELYDIVADPEELNNLYPSHKNMGDELLAVLRLRMNEIEVTYQ